MSLLELIILIFIILLYIFTIVDIFITYKNVPKHIIKNKSIHIWEDLWGISKMIILLNILFIILFIFIFIFQSLSNVNWNQKIL